MQQKMEQILARLNSLLEADGSRLSLVEMNAATVTIRFEPGADGPCEQCVMDSHMLEMLVKEAVSNQLPAIDKVTLVTH